MTIKEIKESVNLGKKVYWSKKSYEVIKDKHNQYLILCVLNNDCIGLTWKDGTTLNGKESEFFTE